MSYITIREGTDKKIATLEITEGSDVIHIQRIAIDVFNVYFANILDPIKLNGAESFKISCGDIPFVKIKVGFASSSDSDIDIGVKLANNNGVSIAKKINVNNTGILDPNHNYYISEEVSIDTLGFDNVEVILLSSPTGNVRMWGGGEKIDVTRGYVFGGVDNNWAQYNTNIEYSHDLNTYTFKLNIPVACGYHSSASYLFKGYVLGGIGLNKNYVYDKKSETWLSIANIPSPDKRYSWANNVGGKLYLLYGKDGSNNYLKSNYEYNTQNDTWVIKTEGPSPGRAGLAGFVLNYYNYAIGGGTSSAVYVDNDRYDYKTNSWVSKTNYPRGSSSRYFSGRTIINKGYTVAYTNYTDEYIDDVWINKTNFPPPNRGHQKSFSIGNKFYQIYGDGVRDCDEFNPQTNTWANKADAPSPALKDSQATQI